MASAIRAKSKWTFFFLALACLVGAEAAIAQSNIIPPVPSDFSETEFYLITVGRGDAVEARFGHSIVRMVDKVAHTDVGYNWGIFDFNDPAFVLNFYIGNLRYMLGISRSSDLLQIYRDYEKRRYVQQHLNLTTTQKAALFRRFYLNALPENVHYQYIHFFDNCSTRIRDHLDAALSGAIKQKYGAAPGAAHFRYYIRSGTDGSWWSYLGLDMLSNSMLDRPISKWEEMFLPSMLRTRLDEMPALDDKGRPVPGLGLLGPQEILIDRPEPLPGVNPYFAFGLCLTLLAVAGTLAKTCGRGRWMSFSILLYGLWSSVWGLIMTINWLVSNHKELKHNANLWLFWPLDLVFVFAGLMLFWRKGADLPKWLVAICRSLGAAHIAGFCMLLLLWFFGIVTQDVMPALASFGPITILTYAFWCCLGRCSSIQPSLTEVSRHAE